MGSKSIGVYVEAKRRLFRSCMAGVRPRNDLPNNALTTNLPERWNLASLWMPLVVGPLSLQKGVLLGIAVITPEKLFMSLVKISLGALRSLDVER